jgi:hypothetical protein
MKDARAFPTYLGTHYDFEWCFFAGLALTVAGALSYDAKDNMFQRLGSFLIGLVGLGMVVLSVFTWHNLPR